MREFSYSLCVLTVLASSVVAGDWRQFRGNNTDGVADDTPIPTEWSAEKNIAWKVPLEGRGLSCPIVVGDRVFITSCSGYRQDRLHVICFSAKDGSTLWERQFWATGRTGSHPKMSNASSTPASDGKRIFALYSSNDLVCLDLDGNLEWFRGLTVDFPNASNSLGMSSSPIVVGDTLITQIENDSQSLALGIDVATGESRWTSERPKRANWTSPAVLRGVKPEDDLALLQSSAGLAAVNPRNGSVVFNYGNGASTIPSSTVSSRTAFVPSNGIVAFQFAAGSANPEILWKEDKLKPGTGTPTVYRDMLYCINNAGVVFAADAKTGDIKWQVRLEGPFSSSPVAAAGHLIIFNEKGLGQVVKLTNGEKGEIVSKNDLGETILCTPAIANGAIYVRSDQHLWKLALPQ
jgi:outer membrane protein assembly factor BamB